MDDIRDDSQDIDFDESLLEKVRPRLAAAKGFELSADELRKIFGINASYFSRIPKRLVVPVVNGRHHTQNWYRVSGWLYVLEPQEWVPVVGHGETIAASTFKTTYSKKIKHLSETKFNAGCHAKVSLGAGGSYYGVTASMEMSSEVAFDYSTTSTTEEELEMKGVVGDEPVHELHVYPVLRCKAVQRQRIDYTINDSSAEIKWDEKSYKESYWKRIWVRSSRLDSVKQLQLHPVPTKGDGLGHKAYMLPVPQINSDGDLETTTLLSRKGWVDWYIYEQEFEDCSLTIDLAAPTNDGAFRPTSSWTTLEGRDSGSEKKGKKKEKKKGEADESSGEETERKKGRGKGGKGTDSEADESTDNDSDGDGKSKRKKKGGRKGKRYSDSDDDSSDDSDEDSNSTDSSSEGRKDKRKKKGKGKKSKPGKIKKPWGRIDCALEPLP